MVKFCEILVEILLYLWQLPQNLVGLCVLRWYWKRASGPIERGRARVWNIEGWEGRRYIRCVTFGRYILTGMPYWDHRFFNMVRHEEGHYKQSLMLGWLYLPFIGICSGLWALWWNEDRGVEYDDFFIEKWADKWGGLR